MMSDKDKSSQVVLAICLYLGPICNGGIYTTTLLPIVLEIEFSPFFM
jgi:hypothetical protein